jgi:hypothetical protein
MVEKRLFDDESRLQTPGLGVALQTLPGALIINPPKTKPGSRL